MQHHISPVNPHHLQVPTLQIHLLAAVYLKPPNQHLGHSGSPSEEQSRDWGMCAQLMSNKAVLLVPALQWTHVLSYFCVFIGDFNI